MKGLGDRRLLLPAIVGSFLIACTAQKPQDSTDPSNSSGGGPPVHQGADQDDQAPLVSQLQATTASPTSATMSFLVQENDSTVIQSGIDLIDCTIVLASATPPSSQNLDGWDACPAMSYTKTNLVPATHYSFYVYVSDFAGNSHVAKLDFVTPAADACDVSAIVSRNLSNFSIPFSCTGAPSGPFCSLVKVGQAQSFSQSSACAANAFAANGLIDGSYEFCAEKTLGDANASCRQFSVDTSAPVATATKLSSLSNSVVIHFSASDAGSGVKDFACGLKDAQNHFISPAGTITPRSELSAGSCDVATSGCTPGNSADPNCSTPTFEVQYTNLNADANYTFVVKARDNLSNEAATVTELPFVLPAAASGSAAGGAAPSAPGGGSGSTPPASGGGGTQITTQNAGSCLELSDDDDVLPLVRSGNTFSTVTPINYVNYVNITCVDGKGGQNRIELQEDNDFYLSDSSLIVGSTALQIKNIQEAKLVGGPSNNILSAINFSGKAILVGMGGVDTIGAAGNGSELYGNETTPCTPAGNRTCTRDNFFIAYHDLTQNMNFNVYPNRILGNGLSFRYVTNTAHTGVRVVLPDYNSPSPTVMRVNRSAPSGTDYAVTVTLQVATTGTGAPTFGIFNILEGSRYNDVLMGNKLTNVLSGIGGNDVIYTKGIDILYGGAGNDVLAGPTPFRIEDAAYIFSPNRSLTPPAN